MKGLISLKNYLEKTNLLDNLNLSNTTSFHWSNWQPTCVYQQENKKKSNDFELMVLNNALADLKNKSVWLCNKAVVKRIDLYALYESYLDSRLRLTWFERKSEILFSLDGEQGPFYTLTSMKWYDKKIYAQFVMRKILHEQFTTRSFRLNTAIPVILKFDSELNIYKNIVSIHQITETGIMLKITDKNFINKIKYSIILDCQILVVPYLMTKNLGFHETWKCLDEQLILNDDQFKNYKLEAKIIHSYGNFTNTQRSSDNEFYIFTKYEDFTPAGHDYQLSDIFLPLVLKTKRYFEQDLEAIKTEKLAA